MSELIYRTEDLRPEEILQFFVETAKDREIINHLKARNPVILSGSRGVGKSFLVRVAEAELNHSIKENRILPVYVSFNKSSLINTSNVNQFQQWMLARICAATSKALHRAGYLVATPSTLSILAGSPYPIQTDSSTPIQQIVNSFESSWQNPNSVVDTTKLPTVDVFKDAIQDICTCSNLTRIVLFIDEAAHILLPEQQRQFFTLFRDLRSPYLSCKAAVYPGVTSYGDVFQPAHDATVLKLERDLLASDYLANMREIVTKQGDSSIITNIAQRGEYFNILAYASSGNPRILLKTLAKASKLSSNQINETIREYFRNDIWSEHSGLGEKYDGHRPMVDWGRKFIEGTVLPDLQSKNALYLASDKNSSCFFWVHRDAPQQVKEALRLLAYTGIVAEHATGIRATRAELGTRYFVNLGCLFSLEASPTATAFPISQNLTPKRMSEFGANHPSYKELLSAPAIPEASNLAVLRKQLEKSVTVLDITDWQKTTLTGISLNTLGDVLMASEAKLQEAYYVGEKRARRMRNAAIAAVYEYLSG